jgi:hypothetical protein
MSGGGNIMNNSDDNKSLLKNKVIEYVKTKKEVCAQEVADALDIEKPHASVLLSNLYLSGKLIKPRTGYYAISPKQDENLSPAKEALQQLTTRMAKDIAESHKITADRVIPIQKTDIDLEILLQLKEIHNREELLILLKQWIRILE